MADYKLMRVCIAGHYSDFFSKLVQDHRPATSDEAMAILYAQDFVHPPSFRGEMAERGVNVVEVYSDFPPLQKMTLEETGRTYSPTDPRRNLEAALFANIERLRPDVIYFQSFDATPHEVRKRIKTAFPFVRLITGHNGYMPANLDNYSDIDLAFVAFPTLLRAWQRIGVQTEFLPHAFDPAYLKRLESVDRSARLPLTFLGATGYGLDHHSQRYFLLRQLLQETDLSIWALERPPSRSPTWKVRQFVLDMLVRIPPAALDAVQSAFGGSAAMRRYFNRAREERIKRDSPSWFADERPLGDLFPDRVKPPLFGPDYLRILARSDITINRHTELTQEGLNMRLFEATGAGCCVVTDHREGIEDMFDPDREVTVYRTADECVDKIRFLRSNDTARREIARRGQERTLRDHMTGNRVEVIDRRIRTML